MSYVSNVWYQKKEGGGGSDKNVCEKGVAGVKIHQNGDTIFEQALLQNISAIFVHK